MTKISLQIKYDNHLTGGMIGKVNSTVRNIGAKMLDTGVGPIARSVDRTIGDSLIDNFGDRVTQNEQAITDIRQQIQNLDIGATREQVDEIRKNLTVIEDRLNQDLNENIQDIEELFKKYDQLDGNQEEQDRINKELSQRIAILTQQMTNANVTQLARIEEFNLQDRKSVV